MLSSALQASGHTVGMMPSPHLSSYTERIQINSTPISEAGFADAVGWLRPRLEGIAEELGPPTEFEILTTVALSHLARHCDRLVIEVGMGGRLDATNVLDLGVAIVTNVALDHTRYLGDTVEKIAAEKAGIIKPGDLVITAAEGSALEVVERAAATAGANCWRLGEEIHLETRWLGREGSEIDVSGPGFNDRGLRVPLIGRHQATNAALSVAASHLLDGRPEGISAARWPGRLEVVGEHPMVLLDGGHNPAALARLAEDVPVLADGRAIVVVFGMMADKDVRGALTELRRLAPRQVVFTAAGSGRAERPERLAELWGGGEVVSDPELAAWRAIELAGLEGMVLVCGSLYLVGAVRPMLVAARR